MPLAEEVLSEEVALSILKTALTSSTVSIDTESTGVNIRDGRDYALGISLAWRSGTEVTALYLPLRHRNLGGRENYTLSRFLPVLQEIIDNCLVVYHNAKFDLVSLQTLGLDTVRGRFICTMVLAHLIDENRPFTGKGLDSCARYYLKDDKGKRKSDDLKLAIKCFGWGMLTPDLVCKYAVWDAVLTLQLFEHLQPMATAEQLAETWKHKKAFMLNLIEMEKTGIQVDQSLCEQMTEIGEKRMQEIRDELRLNPGSPKDLKVLLNDKLGLPPYISAKTGNPSFDKEAMKWYEDILSMTNNTTGRLILEYRGWQKSVSSNYKSYLTHLSPDGRLRPNYLMHGTLTGRLSCREPNLQQIPKTGDKPWNGKMKACFVAQPGYVLRSVDYSQLELRLATVYAQEPSLMAVFNEGRDIFTEMSKELEMSRNDTKTFVYSTQYGGGEKRISNVFGVPRERARELRQNYYATYPKFKAASDRIARACREEKKIRLWSGRYRHFLYPEDEAHKAFNSLCQGGGADIVERSITRLFDDGISDGSDCRVLLQIHDEVVAEVREDRVAYFDQAISESMARVDFHPKLTTVKFAAQAGLWGGK